MLELFRQAGWVAWPLGLFSVVAFGIILERLFTLARLRRLEDRAAAALHRSLAEDEAPMLNDPRIAAAPISQVVRFLLETGENPEERADLALAIQRLRFRRYIGTLATIGSTAPFIGLFGTVLGVMAAFRAMSHSGLSGEAMAAGISEALSATALGLLVAIPSVIAYNYLLGRTQALMVQVQAHLARLADLLSATPARPEVRDAR